MNSIISVFASLFVLAFVVRSGLALEECYSCDSNSDGCGDPFAKDKINPSRCASASNILGSSIGSFIDKNIQNTNPTGCMKIELKQGDHTIIKRGCIYAGLDGVCEKAKDNNKDNFVSCDICTNDNCNGAGTLTIWKSIATFLTLFVATRLF